MYMYAYVYIYTYINMYVFTYTWRCLWRTQHVSLKILCMSPGSCEYVNLYIYINMYSIIYIYIYIYIHMYIHKYVCIYIYIAMPWEDTTRTVSFNILCMSVGRCEYVYVFICIYIHIYMHMVMPLGETIRPVFSRHCVWVLGGVNMYMFAYFNI